MTPELMQEGARVRRTHAAKALVATSGGREASYARVLQPGTLDVAHGAILYLDDITVSFDGFKALNALSLASARVNCAASSAPTVRARPR